MAHIAKIDELIALAENITKTLTDYKHATSRRSRSARSQLEPRIRTARDAPLLTIDDDHRDNDLSTIIEQLRVLAQQAQLIVNDERAATNLTSIRNDDITQDSAKREDTTREDATRNDTTHDETTQDNTTRNDTVRDHTVRDDTTRKDAIRNDTARDDTTRAQDKTTRNDTTRAQDNTTQDNTTRDNTTQGNTTQDNTTREDTTRDDNIRRHFTRFPCTHRNMGENMVSTILRARDKLGAQDVDERGYLVLKLDMSWDRAELVEMIRKSPVSCDNPKIVKGFQLDRYAPGVVHAPIDGDANLKLSEFQGFQTPDAIEPTVAFQNLTTNSSGKVSYLITEPLNDHWVNTLLHAGSKCSQRPPMLGINSVYWYVSCDKNTPAPLHREDGNTGSANLLLAGAEKQWLFIHKSSSERLEYCVRQEFPDSRDCAQFVRHLNIVLETSWLDERGIGYEIVHQRPGDVVVTLEGLLYHEVINTGSNFAIAINWEQPGAPNDPIGYRWCQKGARQCGKDALVREDFVVVDTRHGHMDTDTRMPNQSGKRQAGHVHRANAKKSRTAYSNRLLAANPLSNVSTSLPQPLSSVSTSLPQPLSSVSNSLPQRIRQLLFSRDALAYCISLIQSWRSLPSTTASTPTQNSPMARVAASDKIVRANSSRCEVDVVLLRFALYDLATAVEDARQGALRLSPEQLNEILTLQGFSNPSRNDRERLKRRLRRATIWYEMCRISGPGLLCLLPPHCIPETSYSAMTNPDLDEFKSIISTQTEELTNRCKIGASIRNLFSIDFEFRFEYQGLSPDSEASEEYLIEILQPVVYPSNNLYAPVPSQFWPRPTSWIWDWPQDPTWAPEGLCTDCATSDCVCFANLPQNRHRIHDYGAKGRGVYARGASPNELAFHKGDYIQEIVGELKPSNFETDNYMAIDVYRPDIGSVACRLYFGEKNGNWTRLVNHCCDPCAEIAVVISSGRARVMLRASRDIPDGKEITVSYGDRFVRDNACLCEVCHQPAV